MVMAAEFWPRAFHDSQGCYSDQGGEGFSEASWGFNTLVRMDMPWSRAKRLRPRTRKAVRRRDDWCSSVEQVRAALSTGTASTAAGSKSAGNRTAVQNAGPFTPPPYPATAHALSLNVPAVLT